MLLPARSHLAVYQVLFAGWAVLCGGLRPHAQESPAAAQDSYKAISGTTAADSERWQRLAALYRAESTEIPERRVVDGHSALWISRSEKKSAADRQRVRDRLTALRSIHPDRLDVAGRLDWRVLLSVTEADVELSRFPTEYASPDWPDNDLWWRLDALPRNSIDDFRQRLAWLRGTPYAVKESLGQLQRGMARRVYPSRNEIAATIQRLRELLPPDPLDSPYVEPFAKNLPAFMPEATKAEVLKEALDIYRTQIKPAYSKLLAFLERTYLPNGRAVASLTTLPSGQRWYAAVVRRELGRAVTPDQVHKDAQTEVRRLTDDIERLARSTGYQGSLTAFMADVRKDASCGRLDAPGVETEFKRIMSAIEPALPRLFLTIPKTSYEVKPVPSLPPGAAGGQARPGSLKDGRPGQALFQVPVASRCAFFNIALHEALPGHLLQMHAAAERGTVSPLRRDLRWVGYSEGWAMYASSLAEQLGVKLEPYVLAERINGELFMAVRAVIETGIHGKGWTREEANAFYKSTMPWTPEARVSAEVDAAISSPGHRLAYLVGRRKFAALRENAEKELGPAFDVRRFHDVVLRDGPLPLDVLTQQVGAWVIEQKRSTGR